MRDWLAHRVAATPDAEALAAARSGRTWTYAELDDAADAMAGRLAGLGVEAGDHVCVAMRNRPQYATLVHATMRLGARLVPLSAELTPAELGPQLARADATVLVCDADTEGVAVEATTPVDVSAGDVADGPGRDDPDGPGGDGDPEGDPASEPDSLDEYAVHTDRSEPSVPLVSVDDTERGRVAHLRSAPDASFDPATWERSDPLLMLFTSGTTGEPKPVVLTMGNVLTSAVASAFRLGVTPDDRYLATLSFHHTGGIMPLYRTTLYGTSVVLRSGFDPGEAADDLRKYEVTGVSLVPTMLRRMLDARGTLSDSLRVVLLGGAPAPEDLIDRCHDYSVPVHPTYGMTEAASQIATARPAEAEAHPGTVGRPQFWTDLTVRDDGEVVPAGETGELVVDGPSVTPGYYRDPEATDAAFGAGGLHTGDAGYRDEDGYVHVLNRLDDRIVTGGENVDPGEVVSVLRDHPGVAEAAVAGVPDDEWGERVGAVVVPTEAADLSADDLESFCRERLAPFKLPRTVRFRERLPRTDTGTVERTAVRDLLADADPETEGASDGADGTEGADESAATDRTGGTDPSEAGADPDDLDATGPDGAGDAAGAVDAADAPPDERGEPEDPDESKEPDAAGPDGGSGPATDDERAPSGVNGDDRGTDGAAGDADDTGDADDADDTEGTDEE